VTPCLCGIRRLKRTLSVHQMICEWIWNNGGMILTGETDGLRDKRVPLHTRSPQIPHGLTLAWTPSSAVKSRQLASFFRVPLLLTENNMKQIKQNSESNSTQRKPIHQAMIYTFTAIKLIL
jgi:hypothetical protein